MIQSGSDAQRDGRCTAEGCDLPPGACHVHHDHPWSRDEPTDTDTRLPNGKVSFYRRT